MKIRDILTDGMLMDFLLKCHDVDYEKECLIDIFEKWLDTEVPEPKEVKPKEGKLQSTYQCPKCDCTVHYLNRYCHYCGTKIDW